MAQSPLFRFYRRLSFPMPIRLWERLPRLATHKNEYWDGCAQMSPRPQMCSVALPLAEWVPPPPPPLDEADRPHRPTVAIRRLGSDDWAELPELFLWAFGRLQPLSSWRGGAAARASRAIINWTRLGRDGPLVDDACFVAHGPLRWGRAEDALGLVAAAIVVWLPAGRGRHWEPADGDPGIPHPTDPARRVVPHLNWMIVHPELQGSGVALMLLAEVVPALRRLGCRTLTSAFTLENAASMRWHWRAGFRMPPSVWSGPPAVRVDAVLR
jgi:GNAT superfamily N-acetyltransferase